MSFLNFIYRNGIIVAVPLFVISAVLLVYCILQVVKLGDRNRLHSLPMMEQQTVRFDEAGTVVLSLEGPRFSKRFSELSFDLITPDGRRIASSTNWFHMHSSAVTTIRMELVSFPVPTPGQYVLRVQNLGSAREDDSAHTIVLSKPHHLPVVGLTLGIIFSAGLLICSIVLFGLRLFSKGESL